MAGLDTAAVVPESISLSFLLPKVLQLRVRADQSTPGAII